MLLNKIRLNLLLIHKLEYCVIYYIILTEYFQQISTQKVFQKLYYNILWSQSITSIFLSKKIDILGLLKYNRIFWKLSGYSIYREAKIVSKEKR